MMKKIFRYFRFNAQNILFETGAFVPLTNSGLANTRVGDLFQSGQTLSQFINNVFIFSLSIGAIMAVVRIVWGGYLYMGNEMWSTKSRAKEVMRDAVLGLLLLLAIYLILFQINPDLVNLDVLKTIRD